jgi:hypothetical protein
LAIYPQLGVLEADLQRRSTGKPVDVDEQLEVTAPTGGQAAKGGIVGVIAGGEGGGPEHRTVGDQLPRPRDPGGPHERKSGVNQTSGTGEVHVDEHAAWAEAGELDRPALGATDDFESELGGVAVVGRAPGFEQHVPPDRLPRIAGAG